MAEERQGLPRPVPLKGRVGHEQMPRVAGRRPSEPEPHRAEHGLDDVVAHQPAELRHRELLRHLEPHLRDHLPVLAGAEVVREQRCIVQRDPVPGVLGPVRQVQRGDDVTERVRPLHQPALPVAPDAPPPPPHHHGRVFKAHLNMD